MAIFQPMEGAVEPGRRACFWSPSFQFQTLMKIPDHWRDPGIFGGSVTLILLSLRFMHFFPTLTCGVFVFSSVSAPPPSRPSRPHSLTHSLTHTHSHSLTLTHTHSHSLTLTHTHSHSLTLTHTRSHSLTLTHSHSLSLTLTHSRTHAPTHSLTHLCTAKGSDVRPGVPREITHTLTHSLT